MLAQRPERADQLDAAEPGVEFVTDDGRPAGADQPGGAACQHHRQRGATAQDPTSGRLTTDVALVYEQAMGIFT